MHPKVSIVVPVYNGLTFLNELIDSLKSIKYPNLEFIFSDGGSSDGSLDFLRSIDLENVHVLSSKKKISAAENWTNATEFASGEFIKLVCQDDILYPDSISKQVGDLVKNSTAVLAAAQRDIIDHKGELLFRKRGLSGIDDGYVLNSGEKIMHKCYIEGTNILGEPLSVLFKTDYLRRVMPWDDTNPLMLDLSTYQKVSVFGDFVIRFESVGAFRVSSSSWSTKLAKHQLEMTKSWQHNFMRSSPAPVNKTEQLRAFIGRHKNNLLRQFAYIYIDLKQRTTMKP